MFASPAKLVHLLLILLTAVLAFFGFVSLVYLTQHPQTALYHAIYAFGMFLEALLTLACAYGFTKNRWLYWLAVILTALNALATLFDQVGWIDLLFILFNLLILLLLLYHRKTLNLQPLS